MSPLLLGEALDFIVFIGDSALCTEYPLHGHTLGDIPPTTDILILAYSPAISSALQTEAQALLLAANMESPVFFMDCSNLAKAVAAPGAIDHAMLWEIRRQAIEF
jgi:hypothetical protein